MKSTVTLGEVPSEFWDALNLTRKDQKWPLYVFGQTGTGKTCAAALVYSKWPGGSAMFRNFSQTCELLLGCRKHGTYAEFDGDQQVVWNEGHFWHRLANVDLLVLDEISRPDLQSREEILRTALDCRRGKPTILTGNLPFGKEFAEEFGVPVTSRIAEGRVLGLVGEDRRLIGMDDRFTQG